MPASTSTISIESIETVRADPRFMTGCKKINPNSAVAQASYKGIYPGRTTQDEVKNLLGKPLRTTEFGETGWEYDDIAVSFEKATVSELYVGGDNATTVKDFILQYGCPDEIYALDINQHPYGEYSRLFFLYHRIGFDFAVNHIPASLNDSVFQMTYFMPGTLEDYKNIFLTFSVPTASKPMTWDDAVH